MSGLGALAGAVGVGTVTVGSVVAALWLLRLLRVGQRLATLATFAVVGLVAFGLGTATGYVDGGRLLADLWGLGRATVDVALPVLRSLLGV